MLGAAGVDLEVFVAIAKITPGGRSAVLVLSHRFLLKPDRSGNWKMEIGKWASFQFLVSNFHHQ
jgi:hypothetical protein